jgi:RNA polymerase sigma-70 factor (ECF subfamily)
MVGGRKQRVHGIAQPTDRELVAQSLRAHSAEGASAAFSKLVMRYHKLAISVAYRVCGDAALAEDVAQDAFVRVWSRLSEFRPDGNFRAWLMRITTNMAIDAVRRRRPQVDIEDLALEAPGQGPEGAALSSERADVVRAALMRLSVQSRTILVLREYQSLSYQEIAEVLDIPLGTVKSRLSDARRRLKAELSGYLSV